MSEPAPRLDVERARALLTSARRSRVLVVGDCMIDRYLVGRVERISPEAPVPVVRSEETWSAAGGAANVAVGVAALGVRSMLFGAAGKDDDRTELETLLEQGRVAEVSLLSDAARPTSVKTRVMARQQQMLRIDRESDDPLPEPLRRELVERVRGALDGCDAVALVDYDKGVLGPEVGRQILEAAADRDVPSVVDPKLRGFFGYRGAHVFKPNATELAAALGRERPPEDEETLRAVRDELACEALLVTRGEAGMSLLDGREGVTEITSQAREVYDVSGAGDTVTAVLAATLAGGAGVQEAAVLANFAAGLEVQHLGAVPVEADEILAALEDGGMSPA